MKSFLKKAGRIFLVFFILVLIGISAALGIAFYLKNRELTEIYNQYNQATDNLNQSDKENQLTIGNLQDSYKQLNQKIADLTKENETLKSQIQQDGFGAIKGTILPFIVGDAGVGQFQLVCASNSTNTSFSYCLTVSGLDPKFTLVLPAGTYKLTAKILGKDNQTTVNGYQGVYDEYIQCVVKSGASKCDKSKLTKVIAVEVKAGQTVENINPSDWNTITATP